MLNLETAKVDYLTKCYVKESLGPILDKLMIEDKAFSRPFSILLLDVDHFKSFNDTYGHLHGDAVLKFFSSSLRIGLEESGAHIFRFGGDEFVVLFTGKDPREVYKTALFLRYALRKRPLLIGGKLFNITFSGGIASSRDGKTPEEVLACADKAMYVSKKHGRARATVYSRIAATKLAHTFSRLGTIVALLAILAFLSWRALELYFPDLYANQLYFLKRHMGAVQKKDETVILQLKSGRSFKGVVARERPDEIDFQLSIEKGSGSITIKKSDIKDVIKARK